MARRDRLLSGCACECVSVSCLPVCVCVRERERERERGCFDSIICGVRGLCEKLGVGCMGLPPTACGGLANANGLFIYLFIISDYFHSLRQNILSFMTKKEIDDNQGNIFGIFVCFIQKGKYKLLGYYAIMPFMILSWYSKIL